MEEAKATNGPKNGCLVGGNGKEDAANKFMQQHEKPQPQHPQFNIEAVIRSLESALAHQNGIQLGHYIDAFGELKKLFSKLGVVFSFVETDLRAKHGILVELAQQDPHNYASVERMVFYECFEGIEPNNPMGNEQNGDEEDAAVEDEAAIEQSRVHLQQNGNGKPVQPKAAGSRTLLRLHRALAFLVRFVELVQNPSNEPTSSLFRLAYSETLSKHHTWYIRASVQCASAMVPNRQQLIQIIFGACHEEVQQQQSADVQQADNEEKCEQVEQERIDRVAERFLQVTRAAYDRVHAFYERHGLLELP